MPELPAVEFTRVLIEDHCTGNFVKEILFLGGSDVCGPDELIFSKPAADFFKNDLIGLKVKQVGRWGKQLWITFEDEMAKDYSKVLLMHLGMTGFVQFKGTDRLLYESSPSNSRKARSLKDEMPVWPPKFVKFIVKFKNEAEMAFCDARRFAKIDLLTFEPDETGISCVVAQKFKLGFDPLIAMPSLKEFNELLEAEMKRKINMKALLMQQTFVAGLGNWMADDILMLAGILPKRSVSTLTVKEIQALHKSIKELTTIAVGANADKSKFPKDWLFHIRWQHGSETLTGLKVSSEKIGGRSTFWVPKLQK